MKFFGKPALLIKAVDRVPISIKFFINCLDNVPFSVEVWDILCNSAGEEQLLQNELEEVSEQKDWNKTEQHQTGTWL